MCYVLLFPVVYTYQRKENQRNEVFEFLDERNSETSLMRDD